MTEALQQLIDAVKTLAPQVWEVYLKQVIINGYLCLYGGLLSMLFGVASLLLFRRMMKSQEEINQEVWAIVFLLGGIALLGLGLGSTVSGIQYLANPPYYAIKLLLHP